VNPDKVEEALELALKEGADFADVRISNGTETRIHLHNGTKETAGALICNINLRVFLKGCWGACSSNDFDLLTVMAETAVKMAKVKKGRVFSLTAYPFVQDKIHVNARVRPDSVDIREKIEYLISLEDKMKSNRIKRTSTYYKDMTEKRSIYNSEGANIEEETMYICFNVTAIAKKGERSESSTSRMYISGGYEHVEKTETLPDQAAKRALGLLAAKNLSNGRYCVVIDPIFAGTLFHEVLGHCAEADLILQGNSLLGDKLGSQIAPEFISVWDDPTVPLAPVNYKYDDEGVATQKKPIIQKGILTTYLHSLDSASQIEGGFPGNARSRDYMYSPLVRMSNTYVTGSLSSNLEMKDGLILRGTLGGEVEPSSGRFFIRPEYGEVVEDGIIKKRVKDIVMVGDILATLQSIEEIGTDFYIDSGTCEKEGQTIRIGSGGASLKIANAIIMGG
jgi:TldD protein